jgi:hypothetical protein
MMTSDHSLRPNLRCLVTHLHSPYALTEGRIINNKEKTKACFNKSTSQGYYENFSMHKALRLLKVKCSSSVSLTYIIFKDSSREY